MQIGSNSLLSYLPGSTQAPATQAGNKDADASVAASTSSAAALRETTPEQEAAGVILNIQSEASGAATAPLPKDLVYFNSRKSVADTPDSGDAERLAQYQQAVDRTAGSVSLSVDKDGVLVAQAASPQARKAQDFVSFAVSAMREYADEQERLKAASAKQEDSAPVASMIPRGLAEVQKLAARFKLFA